MIKKLIYSGNIAHQSWKVHSTFLSVSCVLHTHIFSSHGNISKCIYFMGYLHYIYDMIKWKHLPGAWAFKIGLVKWFIRQRFRMWSYGRRFFCFLRMNRKNHHTDGEIHRAPFSSHLWIMGIGIPYGAASCILLYWGLLAWFWACNFRRMFILISA